MSCDVEMVLFITKGITLKAFYPLLLTDTLDNFCNIETFYFETHRPCVNFGLGMQQLPSGFHMIVYTQEPHQRHLSSSCSLW